MQLNRFIYIFILLFVGLSELLGQNSGRLSGYVKYGNGKPAASALVYVKENKFNTFCDEKGFFSIENLPMGKQYNLVVVPFGQKQVEFKANLQKETAVLTINLPMSDETFDLSEVVLVGKNKSNAITERGFALKTIKTHEAQMQNLNTVELLNRSAGVKIRQSAGVGSDININLNGLTGNAVRIFVDGIPIRNYGRAFSLSNIPPALIERIEVYKGVLPSHLSQDALGGGINIILKKDVKNTLSTSYSYGTYNTHQWDLNAAYRASRSGFVANVSSYHTYTDNNYKVWGDYVYMVEENGRIKHITAKRFHDSYYATGIKGSLGFMQKKWADEFMLGFMASSLDKDIQTGASMAVVYGGITTNSKSQLLSLQYKKHNFLVKNLRFNTFATYSYTFRNYINEDRHLYQWDGSVRPFLRDIGRAEGAQNGADATREENIERTISNRTNLLYYITPMQSIGTSMFYNKFSREVDDPYYPIEARQFLDKRYYQNYIISFDYQGRFFNERLKTNVFYKQYNQGLKLSVPKNISTTPAFRQIVREDIDATVRKNGYGVAMSYQLFPKLTLSFSGENAVRMPELTELLGNGSQTVRANYELKPESAQNLNLGITLNEVAFKKHNLQADFNLFYRNITDLIIQGVPNKNDTEFRFENYGKLLSKGIDASLKYNFAERLFWTADVSYNDTRSNLKYTKTGAKDINYKSRMRNLPYFTANTNLAYVFRNVFQKKSELTLNYNFNYTHEFFRDWESIGDKRTKPIIPTQPLHDVGVSYSLPNKHWVLSVNAKNIFDTQVFDNFALQKPGRGVYGKIIYSLKH